MSIAVSYDIYQHWNSPAILNDNKSQKRPSKTPNEGEPNSQHINPGSGQERWYGPDGKPIKDIDHGQGVPHVHDWERGPSGKPLRGTGRLYDPSKDKYVR